jgi:cytochrome c553
MAMPRHSLFIALVVVTALCACGGEHSRAGAGTATAAATTPPGVYAGTIYAAGVGGHMAVASVSIDPNSANPLAITRLERIRLGNSTDYGFHDVRIDRTRGRAGKLFWSTIKADSAGGYRYGRVDLGSGRVDCEVQVALPTGSAAPGYCGSGQSANKFLPVWMGMRGFVDVIDKDTCVLENRVYLDTIPGFPARWNMAHGSNTKDFSAMTFAVNLLDPTTGAALNQGQLVNVDMASLLAGAPVITAIGPAVQGPPATTFFRQEWTPDGGTLVQGGKAAFYRFDASLTEQCRYQLPVENGHQGENHDAALVPDSDYAVMQMRRWVDYGLSVPVLDGQLQLVRLSTCEPVGNPVSMCVACHDRNGMVRESPGIDSRYVSCGVASVW